MKILYLTLALFISVNLQAQFTLTPNGFTGTTAAKYDVFKQEGTAAQLHKQTLTLLHTLYSNPKNAISSVASNTITISATAPNSIRRTKAHVFDMDYTVVLRFKDGKIRMDAPTFYLTTFTDQLQTLHLYRKSGSLNGRHLRIYSPKGLKSELAKADLETFFNTLWEAIKHPKDLNAAQADW